MIRVHSLTLVLTDQGDDRTVTFHDASYWLHRHHMVVQVAGEPPRYFDRFDVVDTQTFQAAPAA